MDKIELLIKAIAVNLWLPKKHGVKKSNNATNVQHIDITPLSHLSLSQICQWLKRASVAPNPAIDNQQPPVSKKTQWVIELTSLKLSL